MKKSFLRGVIGTFFFFGIFLFLGLSVVIHKAEATNHVIEGAADAIAPGAIKTAVPTNEDGPVNIPGDNYDGDRFNIKQGLNEGAQEIYSYYIYYVAKWSAAAARGVGIIFDTTIDYTTVAFEGSLNAGIQNSWKIVRDLSNIVIVFSLLYLAILTIWQGQGFAQKKVLAGILLSAVLINFSFFFAKEVVFNLSNGIGTQILDQVTFTSGEAVSSESLENSSKPSYSASFVKLVDPQKLFSDLESGGTLRAEAFAFKNSWDTLLQVTSKVVLLVIVLFFLCIIFIGVSLTMIYRYIVFIFLIILSPIGLISTQIPFLKKIGVDWMNQIKKQALYYPAFAITLYVALLLTGAIVDARSVEASKLTEAGGIIEFMFSFILIVGVMFSLLLLPQKLGDAGSNFMSGAASTIKKRARALPGVAGRFGGRVAAGGTARVGRSLIGGAGAAILGGATEERRKAIQEKARGNGISAWYNQQRLKRAEGLKERTFDFRNTGVGKKLKLGNGIKSWNAAVAANSKNDEDRMKKEMKLFGYDKMAETDLNRKEIVVAEKKRDRTEKRVQAAREQFEKTGKDADLEVLKAEEKLLKEQERLVGMAKNIGQLKYLHDYSKRITTRMDKRITHVAGFDETRRKVRENWEKEGVSKNKKKNKAEQNRINRDFEDSGSSSSGSKKSSKKSSKKPDSDSDSDDE